MPSPEQRLNDLLANQTTISLATAESCTGGHVAGRITNIAGSSAYFHGGIVSYTNEAKAGLLGVPEDILANPGAVSDACARAMAEGTRRRLNATIGISTTGIAGPGGATERKPVGLVYIGLAEPEGTQVERHVFEGDRAAVMDAAATRALELLVEAAEKLVDGH
ncbi:MAG TPA: CinA family protein [Thermomicrobiales bacterium]|nr:CinA family protein [Thermomicrobiales bacterium]